MAEKTSRIISAIIAMCLSASLFAVSAPVTAAEETDNFEEQKLFLESIGILKFSTDENSDVSRGQFTDMAMRSYIEELPSVSKTDVFNDVIPNYEFKDAVEAAYNNNIVRGMGDNDFGVNEMITPKAAVTIMLRILGYEPYIEQRGDFESNYISAAAQAGLLKKIDISQDKLSFGAAVQLMCNAVKIAPIKADTSSNSVSYYTEDGETLISDRLNIYEEKGVLTDTSCASLTGGAALEKGYVKIGGKTYRTGNTRANDFIGYNVHIYYKELDEGDTVLYIEDNKSDVTVIDGDSYSDYSDGTLSYYTSNNSVKQIRIGTDAVIIYNGALVRGGQFDKSLFDVSIGNITVIKKFDDEHTAVIIKSYRDTVYDRYSDADNKYMLIDKYESDRNIPVEDEDMFDIRDTSGKEMKIEDIPHEAVISAAVSLDGSCGYMIVNQNKLTQAYALSAGEDKATFKLYSEEEHTYNETEYPYCDDFIKHNKEKKTVKSGLEYMLYIDAFGYIAYAAPEKDVSDFYAYIIRCSWDDADPDKTLMLKLFKDDGKTETYKLSKNVKIDGINCKNKDSSIIINMLGLGADKADDPGFDKKSKLVYVSLTFDSEIRSIDTCLEETDEREKDDSLYRDGREADNTLYKITSKNAMWVSSLSYKARYAMSTKAFNTGIFAAADTKIMAVPRDSDDPERFKMLTTDSFFNDRAYLVKAYSRDDERISPEIIVFYYHSRYSDDFDKAEDAVSARYAAIPFERPYDGAVTFVDKITHEYNEETSETDTVLYLTNLASGAALKFSINDEELLSDGIEQGDIVRYMTIGGSVCYLEKLYAFADRTFNPNPRPIKWNTNRQVTISSYYLFHNGTFLSDPYGAESETGTYSLARAVVTHKDDKYISYVTYDDYLQGNTGEKYRKRALLSSTKVYKYNDRNNSINKSDISGIVAYDDSSLAPTECLISVKSLAANSIIAY